MIKFVIGFVSFIFIGLLFYLYLEQNNESQSKGIISTNNKKENILFEEEQAILLENSGTKVSDLDKNSLSENTISPSESIPPKMLQLDKKSLEHTQESIKDYDNNYIISSINDSNNSDISNPEPLTILEESEADASMVVEDEDEISVIINNGNI